MKQPIKKGDWSLLWNGEVNEWHEGGKSAGTTLVKKRDGSRQSAKKGQMDRVQSSNTRHRPSDEILNGGNCDEVGVQIALDLTLTQRKASEE